MCKEGKDDSEVSGSSMCPSLKGLRLQTKWIRRNKDTRREREDVGEVKGRSH